MKKLVLIVSSNLKKKKAAAAVVALLIFFAVVRLYSSISVLINLDKNLVRSYEATNLADYELVLPAKYIDTVVNLMENRDGVSDYEINDCMYTQMESYGEGMEGEKDSLNFLIGNINDEQRISNLNFQSEQPFPENGIVLNYYLKATGKFKTGDNFYITLGNRNYKFEVVGFSEDGMFANPVNYTAAKLYTTDIMINRIKSEYSNPEILNSKDVKVKLKEGTDFRDFQNNFTKDLIEIHPEIANIDTFNENWEIMRKGDNIMASIVMAIILLFAVLLMVIAIAVIMFNIKNFIDENIVNIGVLKASGYTSKELRLSITLEFGFIALIGCILGIVTGFAAASLIGKLASAMVGLPWRCGIDPVSAVVSVGSVFALVVLIAFICGRTYKKIMVLDALRGGVATHNFKKNHISLEKTHLGFITALGLKKVIVDTRKNISIFVITFILCLASCVGLFAYSSVGRNRKNIMTMSGINFGTLCMYTQEDESKDGVFDKYKEIDRVVFHNSVNMTLSCDDNSEIVSVDVYDHPEGIEYEMLIEGRLPKYDNEIVISSKTSGLLKAEVGDIVYIEEKNKKIDYVVVGIDQKINHMGVKAMITEAAAKRISDDDILFTALIYAADGYEYDDLKTIVEKEYPDAVIVDSARLEETAIGGIVSGTLAICLVFFGLTILIVFLVLLMIGKNKITRERKNIGINKAIGFTTKQLVMQNVIETVPAVALGVITGVLVAYFSANSLFSLCFKSFGMGRCDFDINLPLFIATGALIVLDSVLVSVLFSARIRKIEPVKMLMEE